MQQDNFLHQLLYLPQVWPYGQKASPDGRWIAFVWYHRHANLDVFLVPSDGSAAPIALTHTPDATSLIAWAADSKSIIVSEDHDRDEHNRLFRVYLEAPEKMLPLTMDRPPYFLRGGSLSPDERYLYYGVNFDFAEEEELEATWIYRHDLQTGEKTPIAKPQKPEYHSISLNKPGTHLIYDRCDLDPSGHQIYLVDVEGKEDREILNFGADVKVSARWFPDGERLLVLSDGTGKAPQQHTSLGVYDLKSGQTQWLIDDPQRNIESALVADDGSIFVHEMVKARLRSSVLDSKSGEERFFPEIPGNLLPFGSSAEGKWLGVYYSATTPHELVAFDPDFKCLDDLKFLTSAWEETDVQQSQLSPAENFTWKSVDGLEIQGWLYRAEPNPKRAVLFIHGGPTYHSEDAFEPELQYYVNQGFNVLDVNYRGSTGFSYAYREAIKEDGWGGREQDDIAAAAQALIDAGLAEPGHIGVTGTSYGGYSSWCQITHTAPELVAASAPICGMTDLVVDYETTRPDLRSYSIEMMGGKPDEVPERYYQHSPINFVQNIKGKLLIIQGALDPNVSPENVREVEEKLNEHKIPYETLIFADEGHGILKTKNQEVLYKKLVEFFNSVI